MHYQHAIDPVALSLGFLSIHWYGVMYLISFITILWYGHWRIQRFPFIPWTRQQWSDSLIWFVAGVILGGRIGYVLLYGSSEFIHNPLSLLYVWQGGMSFHGGLIGVTIAMILYAKKCARRPYELGDFVAPMIPIGLFFGRLGNFIGSELWGKPSDLPWAVIFPAKDMQPRHPSQLYEMLLEGVLLFILLNIYALKPRPRYAVSGLFLIGYGFSRILVELVREPDDHIGYLALNIVTMGQILSLPMVICGALMMIYGYRFKEPIVDAIQKQSPTSHRRTPHKRKHKKKHS